MKSSASLAQARSVNNTQKTQTTHSSSKTSTFECRKTKQTVGQSPQIQRVDKKVKSSSLENMLKNQKNHIEIQQVDTLRVPVYDRYSAGSPSVSSTPLRGFLRGSDFAAKVHTPEIYTTHRFETPKRTHMNEQHENDFDGIEKSNLIVAVRVRPQTIKEENDKEMKSAVLVNNTEMSVLTDYGQTHSFTYDHCFMSTSPAHNKQHDQVLVYESLAKPLLSQAFKGFNTCLFAYGQTGSGKSYSVMGSIGCEKELHEAAGIVPRFCYDLFRKVELLLNNSTNDISVEIQISYFEIYKEKIQDLLCPANKLGGSLRVREHPQNGPYVVDLTKHAVNSFDEVQRWLVVGNRHRATAATSANDRSSRSHAIFTITLTQSHQENLVGKSHETRKQSRINFIDLAGSERVASVQSVGDRREEGLTINQSLLTLGRVITALAEQKFVPYRESILTWLLKESLGGDSKTVMLATISPCAGHVEETLSTLRYACQARKIINTAKIGEDPTTRHIRHLREQIRILENRLHEACLQPTEKTDERPDELCRVQQLENEIRCLKFRLIEMQNEKDLSWQEKVTQAEIKRAEAEEALSNYGLSSVRDTQQPCLVNVNQDPLLSGTLFFPLKPGENWVGKPWNDHTGRGADPPAIQLTGLMIQDKHCCFKFAEELSLIARAETYVNGKLASPSGVLLHHGDRIIIGGTHYFHLHNPNDCSSTGKQVMSKIPDFESAHEELKYYQEEYLRSAIREAQEKARLQLITEMEELRQEAALEISLQRHSYEDEIASLNRALLDRKLNDFPSPSPPSGCTSIKSTNWEEIELLLRDTQRKLLTPTDKDSEESSFYVQSMINEINAICRRFHQPYTFSRKEASSDGLQSKICIRDWEHHLVMYWSIDKMRQRLQILKDASDESGKFPTEAFFERGDVWQSEDEVSGLFTPIVREKLEKLLKRHENSMSNLDESRFSLDSSRRSSLLPKSPSFTAGIAETCKELLVTFRYGDLFSSFWNAASSLQVALNHPERTSGFAISLTVNAVALFSVYPGLVNHLLNIKDLPPSVKNSWLQISKELEQRLKNSIEFVMQGVVLDNSGLFSEWISRTQNALKTLLSNYCEISVACSNEASLCENVSVDVAITGFFSAQKKIHEAIINLADDIRMKIAQLPDETSTEFLENSSIVNNGLLVKACHDSVTQVLILLEHCTESIDCVHMEKTDLEFMFSKFNQRIDILLRMGTTLEHLFSYMELVDLTQVKLCAAALECQATTYSNLIGAPIDLFLCDLSFAVGTVHKIVAERKRMIALRRGRDISYSPLPARLLASPSRKKSSNIDDNEMNHSTCDAIPSDEGESVEDIYSISPTAITKALVFKLPTKSSLKCSRDANHCRKTVRFNISD